jgi:PncC family amidohydrolase
LAEFGAVSEETAVAMASGIRKWTGADVGVGVTGIAGPGGATETKPVGLTYIAVADSVGAVCERHSWSGNRGANKTNTAEAALRLVLKRLGEIQA